MQKDKTRLNSIRVTTAGKSEGGGEKRKKTEKYNKQKEP